MKGVVSKQNHSKTINKYAQEIFSSYKTLQQRPSKNTPLSEEATAEREREEEENNWKSPPLDTRKQKKGTKASLTLILTIND